MKPSPAPPPSSGRAIPSSPAEASSAQSLRSNRSPSGSASRSRSRSWVDRSVKIRSDSSRTASCSSVKEKSMVLVPLLSQRTGQAEAEDGDQVPLDLVGAAAEGQDDQAAGVRFEAAGEDGLGASPGEVAGLPHDLHHQFEGLHVEIGAEHLGGGRIGHVEM